MSIFLKGEAKGVTGSRVPYLSGGFHVEGLPDNIRLKKPRQYGSKEIQKIMDCQDSISFILETSEGAPLQDFGEDCKELLSNVFGKCDFKVSKEDVEVLDINETHSISEIKEIISTHWKVLCPEALTELKKKLNAYVSQANHFVLPVYCDDEESQFWLFSFTGSLQALHQISARGKLTGCWLNHESGNTFHLIKKKETIFGKNIIKDNGNVIFETHRFTDYTQTFILNKSFERKVTQILSKQGYI